MRIPYNSTVYTSVYISVYWLLFYFSIYKQNLLQMIQECASRRSRKEVFDYRPARLRDDHFRAQTVELVPQVRTFQFQARFRLSARLVENYFRCRVSVAVLRQRLRSVSGRIAHVTGDDATFVITRRVVTIVVS